jgi:enoyl-CoA hydratase/carnithine racemase
MNNESTANGLGRRLQSGVLWLALDRPRASNAIDAELSRAFAAALSNAARDDSVAAVVLTGSGDRVFTAGIDIKNPAGLDHKALSTSRRETVERCLAAILDFDKPLIAAVNGSAIGLGCMLALLCDRLIAVDQAWFSLPEIDIGIPTFLGISIVARAAGAGVARDLVLTGRRMGVEEAIRLGLAGAAVPRAELAGAAQSAAQALAAKPKAAFALDKQWLARGLREEFAAANARAAAVQPQLAADRPHQH